MVDKPPVILIMNTSPDTVVASAYTHDLREARVDIEVVARQYAPRLVVYDIAPPYEKNWRQFLTTCAMPALAGINFVVTTTNARHVKEVAGADRSIYEIVGKPYDLGVLVQAVKEALDRPATTS